MKMMGIGLLILGLIVSFQNCGPGHVIGDGTFDSASLNGSGIVDRSGSADFQDLQTKAMGILVSRCGNCHNGGVSSSAPNIYDLAELRVAYLVPGHPENSPLYLTIIDGSMPKGFNMVSGAPSEVATLRDWIQALK